MAHLASADLDRTAASREFIRKFTSTEYFKHAFTVNHFDDVDAYLMRGDASAALLVDGQLVAP